MNEQIFKNEMAKAAVKTRCELDPLTLAAYWEEFENWDEAVFVQALQLASRELNFFPTVSQIRQRRFAIDRQPSRPAAPGVYECPQCRDRGYLEIYHPLGYQPIRDKTFAISKHLRTVVVACTCFKGEEMRKPIEPGKQNQCKPLIEFDSAVMKPVTTPIISEQVEELENFVTNDWQSSSQRCEWIP